MNTLYECDYKVTKEMYQKWGNEDKNKKIKTIFKIIYIINIFLLLFIIGINLYYGFSSYIFLTIILILYLIYRAFFHHKALISKQYKMIAKEYGGENWLRKVVFTDEMIQIADYNSITSYYYKDIDKVIENDTYIKLTLKNKKTKIRFYTDCFVEGNWEECQKYLYHKMAETIIEE